jgi:hypothetical protein
VTTPLNDEESARLKAIALRLREVQATLDGESAERRREILQEEIARTFADVSAEDRKRYLELLLGRFASVEDSHEPATATLEDQEAPTSTAAELTPEECLERFIAMAAALSEEQRVTLAKRLANAGFNWVDRDQLLVEVADGLREALGLSPGQQPRLTRMVQLTVTLIDLLTRLDQMALKTFGELAPRSPLTNRPQAFRDAVVGYLTGKSDSVEPQIRAVSAMMGGLMAAMLGAAREFGRQYIERFSPNSIEDVVKGEGKVKLFGNEKALCWDKYKDLARDYATLDLVDRRLRECLGAFAEKKASAAR